MTFIESRNSLIGALTEYIARPVLLAEQVQPETQPPYIIYSVTSDYIASVSFGDYGIMDKETDLQETRREMPTATLSFTACAFDHWEESADGTRRYVFGEDEAQTLAQRAQGWFLHSGEDDIGKAGFVCVDVSGAASRSILIVDDMARRYGFDVTLRYVRMDSRRVGEVEKASPVGTIKKGVRTWQKT